MRKMILAASIATAAALSTSAVAQPANYPYYPSGDYAAPAAGVVAGTVVGLGFAEGWWNGPSALTTAAGAAATGLVAGIGTVALIDAFSHPCHGFRIAIDDCSAPPPPAAAVPHRYHRRYHRHG